MSEIKVNTAKLRIYAHRISTVNQRLSILDCKLDRLYLRVGILNFGNLILADIKTGYSRRLANCSSYLDFAASEFDLAEKRMIRIFSKPRPNHSELKDILRGFLSSLSRSGLVLTTPAAVSSLFLLYGNAIGCDVSKFSAEEVFSIIKTFRDGVKGLGDFNKVLDVFDYGNELISDLAKEDWVKTVGYLSDADKFRKAILAGDIDAIDKLSEKYFKKFAKDFLKSGGVEGFTATAYINLGFNFAENIYEGLEVFNGSNSMLVSTTQYVWHLTGWTVIETGAEIGYEIVEKVGKLVGYDINAEYLELTGKSGVEGFYKGVGMLANELFGDYYNGTKSSGFVQGTAALLGDTVAWYGEKIGNLLSL